MPEGDTIAWTARRIGPPLVGRVPEAIETHRRFALDRWPERLRGRAVSSIETYGKHLFVRFEGGLVLHSHLGMSGKWMVLGQRRAWPGAWLAIRANGRWIVQFDGPTLELMTEGRVRFDRRLASLGPDVLAEPEFDRRRFLALMRGDDPTRGIGDALIDQRLLAGIGNIWKSEGCWEAGVDPWRPVGDISEREALAIVEAVRPRMLLSAREGPRTIAPRVYGKAGRPCPRCATRVAVRRQGEASRTTYWCPGCQR